MKRFQKINKQAGMTYAELIVVLAIFSVLAGVAMFNHGFFQARVDVKNLANDLALKVSQAQKWSSFGRLPSISQQGSMIAGWNPSYGLFFDLGASNNRFYYFSDLNNDKLYQGADCIAECVERINITKGNFISGIKVYFLGGSTVTINKVHLTFTRPGLDASMIVESDTIPLANVSYLELTVNSPKQSSAKVKIYASGRIQID